MVDNKTKQLIMSWMDEHEAELAEMTEAERMEAIRLQLMNINFQKLTRNLK